MMQLNRAKFMVNGGIGYVLKPPPMCKGTTHTVWICNQGYYTMTIDYAKVVGKIINHAKDEKHRADRNATFD